ncbi:hypothetical protein HHK36_021252 [Tetracentron sinense]|uniref:Uncharacterized protein n=1 Tax=Tetracentron sinense TaxID=13715 RepID=A0A834YTI3_TETSI|nr:hypothetical protein HHK36_021252 [Tetracentron sinense]
MDSIESQTRICNEEEELLFAKEMVSAAVLPMVMRTVIELEVLEIMARVGTGALVSAAEIASKLPTQNPDAPIQRLYGLAPICKYFLRNQYGVQMGPMLFFTQYKVFMECWYNLKDAVLEGGTPFVKAHGMPMFEYMGKDPRFNEAFNKEMSHITNVDMKKILETYKGFEDLKELIDVGGGNGIMLNMITSKYPTIKGINFDLPHVIEHAPSYPGVQHVAGDMFETVPKGEAFLLKGILHDWTDDSCLKLLKKCHEGLEGDGKLIVMESIVPVAPETTLAAKFVCRKDLLMMSQTAGGKERTQQGYTALAIGAGFSGVRFVKEDPEVHTTFIVLPMVMRTVIELEVLEIISRAGTGALVSASEIASKLPTQNPDAPSMVDRLLRFLATPSYNLKDAVLEGGTPFVKAHGMPMFEYMGKDPRFNEAFNKEMSHITNVDMKKILETYKGFEDLKELIDVGGGNGIMLNMITSKYPTIKGINFDLPHVIEHAPSYPGVQHVAGDMFETVPKGEAILLKGILHDWTDDSCLKLLKKCHEGLEGDGKLIVMESIVPVAPETTLAAKFVCRKDLLMMSQTAGGKERTQQEYTALAIGAGFSGNLVISLGYPQAAKMFFCSVESGLEIWNGVAVWGSRPMRWVAWKPPKSDVITINTDGSWRAIVGGYRCIFRTARDSPIVAIAGRQQESSVIAMELKVIQRGLEVASQECFRLIRVESDSKWAVNCINHR